MDKAGFNIDKNGSQAQSDALARNLFFTMSGGQTPESYRRGQAPAATPKGSHACSTDVGTGTGLTVQEMIEKDEKKRVEFLVLNA